MTRRRRKRALYLRPKIANTTIRMFATRRVPTPAKYDRSVPATYEQYLAQRAEREAEAELALAEADETAIDVETQALLAQVFDGDGNHNDDRDVHDNRDNDEGWHHNKRGARR